MLTDEFAYRQMLSALDDDQLRNECFRMIYQSAMCHGKANACWHWMVDAWRTER